MNFGHRGHQGAFITSQHATPHHITSHHTASHHITSRRIESCTSDRIAPHRNVPSTPHRTTSLHVTSHCHATQRIAPHCTTSHRIASHRLAAHRIIQITTHTRMIHITSRIRITDIARCAQKIFWHIGFAPRAEIVCCAFLANKKIW